MKTAPLEPLARRVLRALYELAELDCPADRGLLARASGIRVSDVARVLLVLDARGLVRADRARLTLLGLARAARLPELALARTGSLQAALATARAPTGRGAPSPAALRRCAGDAGPGLGRARRG